MKHYRTIAFAALALAMVSALVACVPIDNELSSENPDKQRVEIDHLQPVDSEGDLKNEKDDVSGMPFVDNFVVCYGGYDPELQVPTMAVFNTFEEYSTGVMRQLNQDEDSSLAVQGSVNAESHRVNIEGLEKFNDEEYFKSYYVVAINLELTSGSARVKLEKVMVDGGVTRIYLSSGVSGGVGTDDMASAHVFIGLNRVKFDGYGKIEVYVNNMLMNFSGDDGSVM